MDEYIIEEYSCGRWYPICVSSSRQKAEREVDRLKEKNGSYYRVWNGYYYYGGT